MLWFFFVVSGSSCETFGYVIYINVAFSRFTCPMALLERTARKV